MKHGHQTELPGGEALHLVTIVMCVYNAGEYLRPSLLSVLAQTYSNLEIIIIDDGSTDDCFASISDLLTDSRVRVYHQENATRPVALNRALDLVRGEFYAIQDADDISHATRVERQVEALLNEPQLAAVFCGNELIMNGRSIAPTFASKGIDECKRYIRAFQMPAHDPTGMFRISLVADLRYDPTLPFVEAFDYIMRIGERHPMAVLGECLYGYRILSTSVTRRDPPQRERFVIEALKRACNRRGVEYDRAFPHGADRPNRSKNSVFDNNVAAHFIKSVHDQCRAGRRLGSIRTAVECARLHPLDPHYYKALVYALTPLGFVNFLRRSVPVVSVAPNQ